MKNSPEALLALHSRTDPIDWDSVFQSELPRLYNFFLYKIGDRELAQDLTAAVFERAWRARSKYQTRMGLWSTWLFGIARNVLKEHLRSVKKKGQRSASEVRSEGLPSGADIEKELQLQQEREHLRKILLELPEREQDLIALKYGAGLSNREIAKITHLSESNVGSILHRTVKNIRAKWEELDGR